MFHPDSPERKRDERSKREILIEMKRFCEYYKINPIKVFDGEHGIHFVFPLEKKYQSQSEEDIENWDSIRSLRDFFERKDYSVFIRKFDYNYKNWRLGYEKIHIFIGLSDINNLKDVVDQTTGEIDL